VLNEIKVGPRKLDDGSTGEARAGQSSEAIIGQAHGKYYEAASRHRLFVAANQAAVTWTVALTTNYEGLIVANPRMSSVNLSVVRASFVVTTDPAAPATVGLFVGYDADAECALAAAIPIYNTYLLGPHGQANADDDADPLVLPIWVEAYMSGFTAADIHGTSPTVIDVDGAIIIPPGGYVAIGCLTAVVGMGSIMWEEVPLY